MTVIYELANAMAARGHDVHLAHVELLGARIEGLSDIAWFAFDPAVVHHFSSDGQPAPRSDVIFANHGGLPREQFGLPVVLIQGYRMLRGTQERKAYEARGPKVCIARWLVDVGRDLGVPEHELVYVPNGIRHERYVLRTPIAGRPPQVSFCYNSHPRKGADLALEVLELLRESHPEVRAVVFGSKPAPLHPFPGWVEYRSRPPLDALVGEIYNSCAVFLCTSSVEGFGLPSIEAMACGAALVTTDNGGSRDFAIDGRTALVVDERSAPAIAAAVGSLLDDDARRVELATSGREYVQQFNWPRSAEMLEEFLLRYVEAPTDYGYV